MSRRELVTIAAVALVLGVTPRTVRNYIAQGFFPAYRIPGTRGVRLDLAEVDRAMKLIPATVARPITSQFGPKADIRTLPVRAVVAAPKAAAE